MKKIVISIIVLSSLAIFSCNSTQEYKTNDSYTVVKEDGQQKAVTTDNDEVVVQQTDLPQSAQNFIKQNFGSEIIQNVIKESDVSGDEYNIQLSNGIKINFDANGEWKEVKAGVANQSVDASFLPQASREYLKKNYPEIGIKSIDRDATGIDVELLNNVDLKLDSNGNFLRIDK